jgi:hypothetical protein
MEDFEPVGDAEVEVKIADLTQPRPDPPKPKKKKTPVADGEAKPKKEKKRLRHSRWFITFNTNKRFEDRDDPDIHEMISKLSKRVHEFGLAENLKTMVCFKREGDEFSSKYIKKIQKISGSVEVGPKTHCVHTHFQLIISHWSCVQLDYTAVKQFFKSVFPGGHGYLKQYYGDNDVRDYILKCVTENNLPEISDDKVVVENVDARDSE